MSGAEDLILQELQKATGTVLLVSDIAHWTPAERWTAWDWAVRMADAKAKAEPGTSVSLAWPDHVSHAVHGERQKPRHATKAARQQAKQAATREARQAKATTTPVHAKPARRPRSASKAANRRGATRRRRSR